METQLIEFADALKHNAPAFGLGFSVGQVGRLLKYYELLLKWNQRLHLVAPCSPAEFAVRHVLESLILLEHLPASSNVVDVGSGGGLPIIPCLLIRDDLQATLIESSQKKGVFLNEALRGVLPRTRAKLIVSRFEDLPSPSANFLTCRALDRFSEKLPELIEWAGAQMTFAFFAGESLKEQIGSLLHLIELRHIPHSEKRFLVIAGSRS